MREALAVLFDSEAGWREVQAGEYLDDERNAASAAALHEVAEYVRGLPDDDERLLDLEAMDFDDDYGAGVLTFDEEERRLTSRHGFNFDSGPGEFLSEFVNACTGPDEFLSEAVKAYTDDYEQVLRGLPGENEQR
jgi:hypothetical protein